jgi:hypothetical protein
VPRAVEVAQQRIPRCCSSHPDWPTLRGHLARQFPTVAESQLEAELDRARAAVVLFDLIEDERLPTVELMVRHNLMLLTGQIKDSVRLDPESHVRHRDPA